MKLTDQEKKELLADGKSARRRKQFKTAPQSIFPTFEAYLAALEDLLATGPSHPPRPFVRYTDVKL